MSLKKWLQYGVNSFIPVLIAAYLYLYQHSLRYHRTYHIYGIYRVYAWILMLIKGLLAIVNWACSALPPVYNRKMIFEETLKVTAYAGTRTLYSACQQSRYDGAKTTELLRVAS